MKIRVIQGFGEYEKGQVFEDWPDGMCDILIRRGLIERVVEVAIESAESVPTLESADIRFKRKK